MLSKSNILILRIYSSAIKTNAFALFLWQLSQSFFTDVPSAGKLHPHSRDLLCISLTLHCMFWNENKSRNGSILWACTEFWSWQACSSSTAAVHNWEAWVENILFSSAQLWKACIVITIQYIIQHMKTKAHVLTGLRICVAHAREANKSG